MDQTVSAVVEDGRPSSCLSTARARPRELGDRPVNPLAVLIASQPGMADRLIRLHANDHGRCAICSDEAQRGRYAWPCTIRQYADAARLLNEQD